MIAAIIQSDPVLNVLRREIRRLAANTKVSTDEIATLLPDVLKRDVIEGDFAKQAERRVSKSSRKALRKRQNKKAVTTNANDSSGESDAGTT